MATQENEYAPEASLAKDNCPEEGKEEAGLCPPDALPLLLLPPDTVLEAVDEQLLDAVNPPTLPPVASA